MRTVDTSARAKVAVRSGAAPGKDLREYYMIVQNKQELQALHAVRMTGCPCVINRKFPPNVCGQGLGSLVKWRGKDESVTLLSRL